MADKTGISWTDATWNPIRGCSRVSEGCRNCYAEQQAARTNRQAGGLGRVGPYEGLVRVTANGPRWTGAVRMVPEHLADPIRWSKPRRIFVNSMSDLFHERLTNEQIAAVFGVMAAAPQHTFQVLTKRTKRMREWFEWMAEQEEADGDPLTTLTRETTTWLAGFDRTWQRYLDEHDHVEDACFEPWPLPNVWLGVSVENQDAADERIPELLATPAAVRFLSCEPLLGPVNLDMPRCGYKNHEDDWGVADDEATPWCMRCDSERSYGHWLHLDGGIDWVIAGCESGSGARPCDVAWIRSLRDQCAAAGVAYFLKQATEDIGSAERSCTRNGDEKGCGKRIRYHVHSKHHTSVSCGCTIEGAESASWCPPIGEGDGSKRKQGGVIELPYLDGTQHAEFPEARRG